jgi:hypothetical protein
MRVWGNWRPAWILYSHIDQGRPIGCQLWPLGFAGDPNENGEYATQLVCDRAKSVIKSINLDCTQRLEEEMKILIAGCQFRFPELEGAVRHELEVNTRVAAPI